jgi:hypothetical protein
MAGSALRGHVKTSQNLRERGALPDEVDQYVVWNGLASSGDRRRPEVGRIESEVTYTGGKASVVTAGCRKAEASQNIGQRVALSHDRCEELRGVLRGA